MDEEHLDSPDREERQVESRARRAVRHVAEPLARRGHLGAPFPRRAREGGQGRLTLHILESKALVVASGEDVW